MAALGLSRRSLARARKVKGRGTSSTDSSFLMRARSRALALAHRGGGAVQLRAGVAGGQRRSVPVRSLSQTAVRRRTHRPDRASAAARSGIDHYRGVLARALVGPLARGFLFGFTARVVGAGLRHQSAIDRGCSAVSGLPVRYHTIRPVRREGSTSLVGGGFGAHTGGERGTRTVR